ncbi:MAG: hypothetical protein K0S06_243 [Microvirga sp.]|jgi:hypothetical protein|nr:hypothetical protein [Microvirga sp.]
MRLITHPPEKRAQAKWLGETTPLNCAEIAARVDAKPSTVRTWKRDDKWKRPADAPERRSFTQEQRAAIGRLRGLGGTNADIARVAGCSADTIARVPPVPPKGLKANAAAPLPGFAPEEAAKLHEALAGGGHAKRELAGLVARALALAAADLMSDRTLPPDRRARGMAVLVATIKALPDEPPAAGAALHDHQPGPATFEDTNALLEEIARRFADLGVAGEVDGAPGGPAAADAAAPA